MTAFPVHPSTGTESSLSANTITLSSIPNGEIHGVTEDGVALAMTEHLYLSGDYLPHISLSRTIIMQSSGQLIRDAKAEFWFEGKNSSGAERKVIDAEIVERDNGGVKMLCLKVNYENSLVAGADNTAYTWPEQFKQYVDELSLLRGSGIVFIPLPSKQDKYLKTLKRELLDYKNHAPFSTLRPFYSPSEQEVTDALMESPEAASKLLERGLWPISSWASMNELHQHMLRPSKMRTSNTFASLEAAEVILNNANYLENLWEETIIEKLSGGTEVAFAVLSKKVVLAFVRYKDRKELNANIALNDRMSIEIASFITVTVDSDGNIVTKSQAATGQYETIEIPFSVNGKLSANRTEVEADFELTLTKRNAQLIIENRSQVKKQIEAVSRLCARGSRHYAFHDILLGEDLSADAAQSWLLKIVGDQSIIDNALKDVIEKARRLGRPLNSGQESILRNVQYSHHRLNIVRGPPGCGKTTLIAAAAEFLVRCSKDIGIFLPSLVNGFPMKRPQRVYRKHLEEETLLRFHDLHGIKEDDETDEAWAAPFLNAGDYNDSDAAWYDRMINADKKREMEDPRIGITADVISTVMRNPGMRVVGNMGDDRGNVVPVFLEHLRKLEQKAFKKWKAKEKTVFKDAWSALVKHFIGQKHVICCTVGNITSGLMSRALRNFKSAVIMIDEASLMTDPALWNAVVNLITEVRIQNEFGGRSPVVNLILIGDEAQGYPLVKTETEAFNCFGSQLARSPYERLVLGGAFVQEMTEQFRMVPALMTMPNQRWYGGKLRCSAERQKARLTTEDKVLLQQFFDIEYPQVVKDAADRAAAEVEPHTQSRLNMGNVDVILKIFRDLMYKDKKGLAKRPNEVVILTFYNAQRRRLLNALLDLEKELGLGEGSLDGCLHTVDSFQGREAKYIILDLTVCSYFGEGSLGHAGEERKACVAATRARDAMIVVGNLNILKANFSHEGRLPFVIDLLKTLEARGAYKTFNTDAEPEKQVGAKLDSELRAEAIAKAQALLAHKLKQRDLLMRSKEEDLARGDEEEVAEQEVETGSSDDTSSTTVVAESENRSWDDLKAAVKAMGLRET
ncbi:ATP-dependent helicase upf1 [Cyphellophora attinorum]|uniref:ATP-dependent helicase upf1 n=1 Tax=Cyphellophora attinorum TaxID=1664694 RepID=A0A0N1NYS4_9EURO|nr:ATP-dependent helicase upf1 [Phialophora attinorum]KPI37207.1 ATP-dependent helicase upf1 [Phialophora attinorum]